MKQKLIPKLLLLTVLALISFSSFAAEEVNIALDQEKIVKNTDFLVQLTSNVTWNTFQESGGYRLGASVYKNKPVTVRAEFTTDCQSVVSFQNLKRNPQSPSGETSLELQMYIDGSKVRGVVQNEGIYRITEKVPSGHHVVDIVFENNTNSFYLSTYLFDFCILKNEQITVNLLEPGSLGTEVLFNDNIDGMKDVRNLKVIGRMNDNDWEKIAMMDNLVTLDLTGAQITEIPKDALSRAKDKSFEYLYEVKLPTTCQKIGDSAFELSPIHSIVFPEGLKEIGENAFRETCIQSVELPSSLETLKSSCFSRCYSLRNVTMSSSITDIPSYCFSSCHNLKSCTLPEGIKTIGWDAFGSDYELKLHLPESVESIASYAFSDCYKLTDNDNNVLVLPLKTKTVGNAAFQKVNLKELIAKGISSFGNSPFANCSQLTTVDLGPAYYNLTSEVFYGCSNVTRVTLRSPSVITYDSSKLGCDLSKVDLIVPDYLIPSYKLDKYWYNYKTISGFSTADIQDWEINNPVVLNRNRFEGTPNIAICGSSTRFPSLKINGDAPMAINNLYFNGSDSNTYYNYPGQTLSNCDNITISGEVRTTLWSKAKYWYFYSLPFDVKISEITHSAENVQKAIRYYDGANRAENGASGSWKNYDADAIIPAGTGFIMQTNVDTWNYFHALDNESKQQCVGNKEFVTTLAVNDSENASNKGWNLVGNPWQCYYNDHALNFTGPITVWNVGNRTYTAYSITDDDYAISPNEAFFVQCPNEQFNTIGFPTNGRQLTKVIENQNASNARVAANVRRQLVDVIISNGEYEDQTRVVLNEQASMDYELSCDAAKMMSMDASVPQVFTTDAIGTQYAINERPTESGIIPLGFLAPADGTYTFSIGRNSADEIILVDYETGTEQSIVGTEYHFTAHAGMNEGRFALKFSAGITTGIHNTVTQDNVAATIYNLAGQRINSGAQGVNIVNGKKVVNQ